MKLSVIVPVLNEEKTIGVILDRVLAVGVVHEVIVVDDGSTDRTAKVAGERGARVKVVRHGTNRGKGSAVVTGLAEVTGDVVVVQDGDLEYDPADFVPMLGVIESGESVVFGSRILGKNKFSYLRFYFGGRALSLVTNLLYGTSITDEPTCYKMARTEVYRALELKCRGFEFCPEMTAKVSRLGHAIKEIPIHYEPRSIDEGKKIRWWDGVIAIGTLLRYRFWSPSQRGT